MPENITPEARKKAIDAAVVAAAAAVSKGQEESKTFKWKGADLTLPVAKIALENVLLNPRSHRIRAQIASLDPKTAEIIDSDPYGDDAQDLIRGILAETEGYERIRNALERDGQEEPGVLTEAGVLINANTRAVALGELGKQYIRVNVLPSDATEKELNEMELKLQMAVDVKQDYTLTSELLFIEDLINANVPTAEIGRQLRKDLTDSPSDKKKAKDEVELQLRLLSLIRDVIAASGGTRKFTYFDDKKQALIEISQDYQAKKNAQPAEAVRVRDAQLTGLLAGIDYRKLRAIDKTLIDEYLRPAMAEEPLFEDKLDALLSPAVEAEVDDDDRLAGLDLLDDDELDTPTDEVTLTTLFNLLVQTDDEGTVVLPGDDDEGAISRKSLVTAVSGAIIVAIENKDLDETGFDYLQAPIKFVRNATRVIDKATKALASVRHNADFDLETFDSAVEQLDRATESLAEARAESLSDATDGVIDDE